MEKSFDYELNGIGYSRFRKTDPHIFQQVHKALGNNQFILNMGAGPGSYEPQDRYVTSIEPSYRMRSQRPKNIPPAIRGSSDLIPFDDQSFDASMAMITIHHWSDLHQGLRELRRVTRNQILILTFDPDALDTFWNAQYFPELIAIEKRRYPSFGQLQKYLGGSVDIEPVSIPLHCTDGFQEAFYGRPECFLDPNIRKSQSAWGFLHPGEEEKLVKRLEDDLNSGAWDQKFGHLRSQDYYIGSLRLLIAHP
jgi:SAM-dependent methyltransferase